MEGDRNIFEIFFRLRSKVKSPSQTRCKINLGVNAASFYLKKKHPQIRVSFVPPTPKIQMITASP